MRLCVVGPRDLFLPVEEVHKVVEACAPASLITEIVTGDALGVDRAAILYAKKEGLPWVAFGAGWGRLGKGAGPERGSRIVGYLESEKDMWIAISDGRRTRGTENTSRQLSEADVFGVYHQDKSLAKYIKKG